MGGRQRPRRGFELPTRGRITSGRGNTASVLQHAGVVPAGPREDGDGAEVVEAVGRVVDGLELRVVGRAEDRQEAPRRHHVVHAVAGGHRRHRAVLVAPRVGALVRPQDKRQAVGGHEGLRLVGAIQEADPPLVVELTRMSQVVGSGTKQATSS